MTIEVTVTEPSLQNEVSGSTEQAIIQAAETIASETSEAQVEIAQIEADRDVQIAEIHAETQEAVIEAAQEVAEDEAEDEERWLECQRNLETLQNQQVEMQMVLASILERLPPKVEAPANPPPAEERKEETLGSQEARAEPERVKRRLKIIR